MNFALLHKYRYKSARAIIFRSARLDLRIAPDKLFYIGETERGKFYLQLDKGTDEAIRLTKAQVDKLESVSKFISSTEVKPAKEKVRKVIADETLTVGKGRKANPYKPALDAITDSELHPTAGNVPGSAVVVFADLKPKLLNLLRLRMEEHMVGFKEEFRDSLEVSTETGAVAIKATVGTGRDRFLDLYLGFFGTQYLPYFGVRVDQHGDDYSTQRILKLPVVQDLCKIAESLKPRFEKMGIKFNHHSITSTTRMSIASFKGVRTSVLNRV